MQYLCDVCDAALHKKKLRRIIFMNETASEMIGSLYTGAVEML